MKKIFFLITGLMLVAAPLFAEEGVNQKELKELMGDSYMIEQDYDSSVKQYREVLAKDPQNIKARVSLADVLSWQQKYEEAVAEYLKALELKPGDAGVQRKLAEVYVWDKKFDEAKAVLIPLLENNSKDAKAKLLYGKALLYSGQTKEAIRVFKELDEASQNPKIVSKGDA